MMMKNIHLLIAFLIFLFLSCANSSSNKNLDEENQRLKVELELFKNLENNRQRVVEHSGTRMFNVENEREVVSVLFDTEDFDIYGRAVWTPNFAERLDFPISYDGFCYTKTDKVLFFNDEFQRALVIFGTYEIMDNEEVNTSHVSSPMLSLAYFTQRKNNEWELTAFKKSFVHHGSWGEMGNTEIKQVGKKNFVLDLSWGYNSTGEGKEWTTFYSIPDFNEIFHITTAHTFSGFEENDKNAFANKAKFSILPSDKRFGDILIEITGTKPSDKEERIISANEDKVFVYDEQAGVYIVQIEPEETPVTDETSIEITP